MSINGLEPEYDVPIQIDVMEKILKRHPKAGLIIAGHGRLEGELKTYISTKPWSSSVLLCGDLPRPVTLNLLAGADLMLRTTWYDGDAISVREALHYSVRVVASDNGMRPNGVVLFPARDPGSLEHAILDTLKQPKLPHTPPPAVEDNLKAVLEVYQELGGQRAEQVNNCCTDKIA
jgi:glycosyltransferase involved in cell wall biosynthesis